MASKKKITSKQSTNRKRLKKHLATKSKKIMPAKSVKEVAEKLRFDPPHQTLMHVEGDDGYFDREPVWDGGELWDDEFDN